MYKVKRKKKKRERPREREKEMKLTFCAYLMDVREMCARALVCYSQTNFRNERIESISKETIFKNKMIENETKCVILDDSLSNK